MTAVILIPLVLGAVIVALLAVLIRRRSEDDS